MEEFIGLQQYIQSTRQLIESLGNDNSSINTGDTGQIFREWNVNGNINEFVKKLNKLDQKCKLMKEKVDNKCVKLYFFGKSCSGKSTIINGLIRKDLLKYSLGHTTNCFVHLEKSENTKYRIIRDNTESLFDDIKEAKDEIHKLSTKIEEINFVMDKFIKVFVPIDENNKIMKENIELIDSPGSGNQEQITKCITEYPKDADIFVFVLMHDITEDDEKFFQFQLENFSIPDIFVLINKWDENHHVQVEEVKEIENNLINKCDQLIMKMSKNSAKNVRDRTYFISASEVLDIRIKNDKEYLTDEMKKRRYENFELFENKLSEYIRNQKNIKIQDKSQRYSQEIIIIKEELQNELQKLCTNILKPLSSDHVKTRKEYKIRLEIYKNTIKEKCDNIKYKCIENIMCPVTKMMNTLNIDDSMEIGENIKKHYLSIDEDVNILYKDLDDILSLIKEKNVDENSNKKNTTNFGKKNTKIKTNMQIDTFPKSKVAVRILSFFPIVGFAATNILLGRIDNADGRQSQKKIFSSLNEEIHANDDDKIKIVEEEIQKIEDEFIAEINKVIESVDTEIRTMEFLEKVSRLDPILKF